MSFLDHIRACNAHDIGKFRPFLVDRRHVGWVRHDTAERLAGFADTFRVAEDAVSLHPRLDTPEARAQAVDAVCAALARGHGYPAMRGERYLVAPRWGDAPLLTVDRGVASVFGVRAWGVHVNGFVDGPDGLKLWIGHRAPDRPVCPGKLDNMIAGGQPYALSLTENLVKEAAEEAGVPRAIALCARPVGAISYCLEDEWGLKPDTMFTFDLEVPADFTPANADGEVARFELMDAAEAGRLVRDTDRFKYNVNLVITDFLIRHGLLDPEDEPDYVDIVNGLRQGW